MFTFCVQKDTIRVESQDFGKDPVIAIREEIHRRYANKVIPEVGLCISLLDILDCSEGAVLYGDGCYYYKTEFRLVMFRPFVGEAIIGKVKSQSEAGVVVTLGFFDDIIIPPGKMQEYSVFDKNRWFWKPVDEEAEGQPRPSDLEIIRNTKEDDRLYIEKKCYIKMRVEEEIFDDSNPVINPSLDVSLEPKGTPPYQIVCGINEQGLGPVDWWNADDAEEEEEEED